MSDHAVLARATTQAHSLSLTAEAGAVAEALAAVIERLDSADRAATATVSFLRSWIDQARRGLAMGPVPGLRSPLDSLTARLGLTDTERRLVVLAGLAEEHEGLAGTLRSLHPLGEPRPTVGLSALVLSESGVDRAEVRRVLGEGSAARLGVLRITGSSGLFERSLTLADQLWMVLHGVDSTPPGLQRIELGPAPAGLGAWLDNELVHQAGRVIRDGGAATVICSAAEEQIAAGRCAALLAAVGGQAFAVRVDTADTASEAARQTAVHAAARDAVPVLLLYRPAASDREHGPVRGDWAGGLPGPLVLCATTGSVHLDGARPVIVLPAGPVPAEQRQLAWRAALPGIDDLAARALAARLPLDPTWVATVARDVHAAGHQPSVATASAALRRRTGAVLPPGAELITPAVPWDRAGAAGGGGLPAAGRGGPAGAPGAGARRLGHARSARAPGGRPAAVHRAARAPASRWQPRRSPPPRRPTCCTVDCPSWSRSGSARPRRTWPRRSTPPNGPRRCSCSTRPTRCSAPGPRSPTPMTGTPTWRPPTCCSAWISSTGWRCSPPT